MGTENKRLSIIKIEEFTLFDRTLEIEVGINGTRIPIMERLEDPEHFSGPAEFDNVVNLEDLISVSGMRASRVTDAQMWSQENPPPEGIRVLEFENLEIKTMVRSVSEIASTRSDKDLEASAEYYNLVKQIYDLMPGYTGVDPKSIVFLGLLRAGGVAGKMLGIPLTDQVLIETKRLRLKEGNGGNISIGIDYINRDDFKKMGGKHWLIADPAGATFASILANLALAVQHGVYPAKVSIWNTVANHKGATFALNAMAQLGIKGEIVAGGYSPGMNDKYYLETPEGNPSVGDAGDWLNRFLNLNSSIVPKA